MDEASQISYANARATAARIAAFRNILFDPIPV